MSYRFKLNKYHKTFIEQINNYPTREKFKEWIEMFYPNCSSDPVEFMDTTEIYEIGGYLPNCNQILEKYKKPFTSEEILEDFAEYDFAVLDKAGLEMIIEGYRKTIADSYRDLFGNGKPNKQQQNEILMFLNERIEKWDNPVVPGLKPYGLEENLPMVRAWDWEYQIWELVKIYREFDWDNYKLALTGW